MHEAAAAPPSSPPSPAFLVTNEYRRFPEFADAVRRDRYIGLCYGPPRVGKTLSARISRLQRPAPDRFTFRVPPAGLDTARTVFWTAPASVTAREINGQLAGWCEHVDTAIRQMPGVRWRPQRPGPSRTSSWSSSTRPTGSRPLAWNKSETCTTGISSGSS